MPVLIWVQLPIAPLALPVLLKGLLAIVIAMPPMLGSYHFAVRPTWHGVLLNGRCYPLRTQVAGATNSALPTADPNRVGQPDPLS